MITAETALLATTAVHVGFQSTVTLLVYPALARVSAGQWAEAHDRHSRAITPLVALVYGALALSVGWALLSDPQWWTWVAAVAVSLTFVTTCFAAWTHRGLGPGHDPALIRRLLGIDRVRAAAATLAVAAAALAVL